MPFAFPPDLAWVPVLGVLCRDILQSAPKAPRDLSDSGVHVSSQELSYLSVVNNAKRVTHVCLIQWKWQVPELEGRMT